MSSYANYLREVRGYDTSGVTLSQIAQIKEWLKSGGIESLFHMERLENHNKLWLTLYFPNALEPIEIEVTKLNALARKHIKPSSVLSVVQSLVAVA